MLEYKSMGVDEIVVVVVQGIFTFGVSMSQCQSLGGEGEEMDEEVEGNEVDEEDEVNEVDEEDAEDAKVSGEVQGVG